MFLVSIRLAKLLLRLGLAAVFLWFGIHKFFEPIYWVNAWVPPGFTSVLGIFGLTAENFIFINGVFEVLVGLSFVTGVGVRLFAFIASIFLILVILINGGSSLLTSFNEVIIRDIGLLGGMLALVFWPDRVRS